MSSGSICRCQYGRSWRQRDRHWVVVDRNCNYSAFNGGHQTPSDYSKLLCLQCYAVWRSKATYVASRVRDISKIEYARWLHGEPK